MEFKECTKCHSYVPLDQFNYIKARKTYHVWCNSCRAAHAKKMRAKTKAKKITVDDNLYNTAMELL